MQPFLSPLRPEGEGVVVEEHLLLLQQHKVTWSTSKLGMEKKGGLDVI